MWVEIRRLLLSQVILTSASNQEFPAAERAERLNRRPFPPGSSVHSHRMYTRCAHEQEGVCDWPTDSRHLRRHQHAIGIGQHTGQRTSQLGTVVMKQEQTLLRHWEVKLKMKTRQHHLVPLLNNNSRQTNRNLVCVSRPQVVTELFPKMRASPERG